MDLKQIRGLKEETEQHITHLLNEFTACTGLNVHNVNFFRTDVTAVSGSSGKEYIVNIEIDIRL
jgi:hypothetical protein